MENTFNFDRFGKVFSQDVKRYVTQFGLTFLILCAMPIVMWLISLVFGFRMPCIARVTVTWMTIWLSAILVPAKAFGYINLQREGVSYAMLPASNLEKFLSIAILCLLTPIAVMACSYGIDSLLTLLPWGGFNKFITGGVLKSIENYMIGIDAVGEDVETKMSVIDMFDSMASSEEIYMFISTVFTVGLFLFGNSLFKTHKTAKTFAVMMGVSYAVSLIMQIVLLSDGTVMELQMHPEEFGFDQASDLVRTTFLFSEIAYSLIAVGLFVGTFFKVKNQKY